MSSLIFFRPSTLYFINNYRLVSNQYLSTHRAPKHRLVSVREFVHQATADMGVYFTIYAIVLYGHRDSLPSLHILLGQKISYSAITRLGLLLYPYDAQCVKIKFVLFHFLFDDKITYQKDLWSHCSEPCSSYSN